jgi:hypothetical protein
MLRQNVMVESMWRSRTTHLTIAGKQRETDGKGLGQNPTIKDIVLSDLLPPAMPHFLKLPKPPKIVPPPGDQVFNARSL